MDSSSARACGCGPSCRPGACASALVKSSRPADLENCFRRDAAIASSSTGFSFFRFYREGRQRRCQVRKRIDASAHAAPATSVTSSSSLSLPPSSAASFARISRAKSSTFAFALSRLGTSAAPDTRRAGCARISPGVGRRRGLEGCLLRLPSGGSLRLTFARLYCPDAGVEGANEVHQGHTESFAYVPQFQQIQPPGAQFVLRDSCLRAIEHSCNIRLSQVLFFAGLAQQGQQDFLLTSVGAKARPARFHEVNTVGAVEL
jgi:hypothetical protein